jgi:hypothetical protein
MGHVERQQTLYRQEDKRLISVHRVRSELVASGYALRSKDTGYFFLVIEDVGITHVAERQIVDETGSLS